MKEFYIYENHMSGGLYHTDHELTYKQRYCEQCGDSDWLICKATCRGDIWRALADNIDVDGSGGYDPEYVVELIKEIPWEDDEE